MTHDHAHLHCAHANLKYCAHCQVPYCSDCGKEWRASYPWNTAYPSGLWYGYGNRTTGTITLDKTTTVSNTVGCTGHK